MWYCDTCMHAFSIHWLTKMFKHYFITSKYEVWTVIRWKNLFHKQVSKTCRQGSRVVRWCWVNFQCRGVLLIWIIIEQGPTALAIGAGAGLFGHFISLFFLPFWPNIDWNTVSKGRLTQNNQPTKLTAPEWPGNVNLENVNALKTMFDR